MLQLLSVGPSSWTDTVGQGDSWSGFIFPRSSRIFISKLLGNPIFLPPSPFTIQYMWRSLHLFLLFSVWLCLLDPARHRNLFGTRKLESRSLAASGISRQGMSCNERLFVLSFWLVSSFWLTKQHNKSFLLRVAPSLTERLWVCLFHESPSRPEWLSLPIYAMNHGRHKKAWLQRWSVSWDRFLSVCNTAQDNVDIERTFSYNSCVLWSSLLILQ